MYEECPLPGEVKDSKRKKLVVIGYSFPSNDFHIRKIVRGFEGELIIVNPSGDLDCYREGLKKSGLSTYSGYEDLEQFLQKKVQKRHLTFSFQPAITILSSHRWSMSFEVGVTFKFSYIERMLCDRIFGCAQVKLLSAESSKSP